MKEKTVLPELEIKSRSYDLKVSKLSREEVEIIIELLDELGVEAEENEPSYKVIKEVYPD